VPLPGPSLARRRRRAALAAALALAALTALGAPIASAAVPGDLSARTYPSARQVRAAQARARAAAATVRSLQARYQADAARLDTLQAQVSAAADAYSAAAAELAARTAETTAAKQRAAAAATAAAAAQADLGRYAAAEYESGGSLGALGALIDSGGPQQYADAAAGLSAVSQQWSRQVQEASSTAALATQAQRTAARAEQEQQAATTAAQSAEQAAQAQVAAATAQVAALTTQEHQMVTQLARLRHTSQVLEQQRQDGLAAAAAARAAAARRAQSGGYPGGAILTSGGSAALTWAQLHPQTVAQRLMPLYGFGSSQFGCLVNLWNGESGWRWSATNPSSGAYGIPQSLPASKMAAAGSDWLVNPVTQIRWGLGYIKRAYGSPCAAWSTWLSRSPHWY